MRGEAVQAAFASFLQYPFGVDGEAAIGGGGNEHVTTAFRCTCQPAHCASAEHDLPGSQPARESSGANLRLCACRWYVVCNSAAFFLSSSAILLELISAMHGDILRKVRCQTSFSAAVLYTDARHSPTSPGICAQNAHC